MHFRGRYEGKLLVWMAIEIMDFGALSNLYQGALREDRDQIAAELEVADHIGQGNGLALGNWLRVISHLRSVCATTPPSRTGT